MSNEPQTTEPWQNVPSIPRWLGRELNESPNRLGQYLAESFRATFKLDVEEVTFNRFPDGLSATLYVEGKQAIAHNVWAVNMATGLEDAGVEVHVVVLPVSSRYE